MKKILSFLAAAFLLCLTSAQIQAQTWTVAGSSTVLFGTAWSPSTASNDMVLQSGSTYKWEKTNLALEAETIEFKVCQNHAWTTAYPSQNYQLQIPTAATYTVTITFNSSSHDVTAVATKTSDEAPQEVDHTWTVAGSSTVAFTASWDPSAEANDMVKQADGTYKWEKADLALTAETIEFKVCKDHAWGTAYPSQNYQLAIPSAGTYTIVITFNEATHAVAATATKAEGGDEPGGDEPGDDPVAENMTVYFVNVPGWEAVDAYVYTEEGGSVTMKAEWPGEAATKTELKANEKDVYSYAFPNTYKTIIFNNGNGGEGNQTANLTWEPAKPYFYDGAWYASIEEIPAGGEDPGDEPGDDPVAENMTVYFVNVPGWEVVDAYVYTEEGGSVTMKAEWPGEAATKTELKANEKDVYSYAFPNTYKTIIFNNGNGGEGNQTANLTWEPAKPYFYDGVWYASIEEIPAGGEDPGDEPGDDPVAENMTVYFVNVPGWDAVDAYVYTEEGGSVTMKAEWPGEAATKTELKANEKDVYSYAFPNTYKTIIFNNGNGGEGNQTANLSWESAKPYFYDGVWYASIEEIPAGGDEPGGDDPQPQSAHYLIGNVEAMGSWTIDNALPMENDEIVLNLEAGGYAFKIVPTKAWDQPGQLDCSAIAAGQEKLSCDGDNNICFTMPSAAEVTIKVVENKVYVLGIPDGEIEIPDTHYLIGDAEVMGAWQIAEAVFMDGDSLELTLPAGTYMFKIVATKSWNQPGQLDCNNLAAGQTGVGCEGEYNNQSNVKFTLAEEATITIKVVNNEIYVLGIPEAGDEPGGDEPEHTYYFIGSMLGWDLTKAIPLENGQITKMIEAEDVGEYEFRLLPQNDGWDNGLGFSDINAECSSEGLKAGAEYNNIKAYFGEGEVKVQIVDGKLCITGNFEEPGVEPGDEPGAATWYVYGYINGADYVGTDYPFVDGVATLPELTADSYIYLHKDNGTAAGVDFWTNGWTEGAETVTMTENPTPYGDKMLVPEGSQSVYMCENADGTLKVSRIALDCSEEEPGDEPVVSYYLIGSMMDWDLENAMLMDGDSIARMMEEGDFGTYEFKVLPQNTSWANELNFYNINTECSSENIYVGDGNNIKVAVTTACEWKVKVVEGQLCITGIFSDPATVPVEMKQITIRAYSPGKAPKIYFWGCDSIATPEWDERPVMIADTENEGWYSYTFEKIVKAQGLNFILTNKDGQSANLYTTGDACYDIRVVAEAEHLQDCQTPVTVEKYCEKPAGHLNNPEFGDPSGRILLTIAKGEGNNLVVKIKNNNEAGNPQTGLNYLWVNAAGSHGVVRYGDGSHDEANVEEVSVVVEFDEPKDSYDFVNIHWAYAGWGGEWAIDGLTVTAAELCDGGEAPQPGEHTYTIAGSATEVFVEAWNPALTENDMIKLADDTYAWKKENITLPAGTIEFKVVEDHSWDNPSYPSSNYQLSIPESGIYTINITFDAESKDIEAVANKTGEAVVMPTIQLAGQMTDWATSPITLTPAQDNLTASVTVPLEAQDYLFKIISGGNWLTKLGETGNYTLHREWTTADHVNVIGGTDNDLLLQADVAGDYTFTWTYADSTLVITFPALAEKYCEKPAGHLNNPEFADPSGRILLTIAKGEGNNLVVKIKNNNEAGNPQTGLNYLWVNAAGSHGVVRYGDGSHDEANVEEVSVVVEFDEPKDSYDFVNIHWAYAGWTGEWALDGLTVTAAELCDGGVAPQPEEHTYTVAGNSPEAFGETWNPALEANDMTKQADGTYKWEKENVTLQSGEFKFKVCEDHVWAVSYPAQDYVLPIAEAGVYTITIIFDAESKDIVANATKTGEAAVINYYLVGSMQGWNLDNAIPMENDELVLTLEANVYQFKIMHADKDWSNVLDFNDINTECSSEGIEDGDNNNVKFTLAQAGDVTIKVVEGQLCVTGDFGGEIVVTVWNVVGDEALIGENWNIDSETTIMTLGEDGKYRYEIESVALAPGEYKWKIVGNHDWNVAQYPQQGDYIINIAEEGNYRIIFTLDLDANAGTEEVTKLEEPVETTYYLAGTFTNWAEGRIAFENGAVAVTLEQSEEAAAFKIIKTVGEQDTWYGNNGTMTEDNCTGWKFETSADDAHLTLSKSGLYTFNLTLNEQGEIHISVVYPSGETGIEAIMNAENAPAKFIYNGQLFIRKAGRLFNAQGQLVR